MARLRNITHPRTGFTLVEIMVVVLIIGIILAIAIPSFIAAREKSQAKTCKAQLREIQYAKETWAMGNKKSAADAPGWAELYPTYLKQMPTCPGGGMYDIRSVNENPVCSLGDEHAID